MAVQVFRHQLLTDAFYETIRSSEPLEGVGCRLWHTVRATSLRGTVGQSNLHTTLFNDGLGNGIRASKIGDLTQQWE